MEEDAWEEELEPLGLRSDDVGAVTSAFGGAAPPIATSARTSHGFDDPEGFGCDEEELDFAPLAFGHPLSGEGTFGDAAREPAMEQFEAEMQSELMRNRYNWPSAMVAWEACPALVEGLIELPTVEEESETCFKTIEGWVVSDPLAKQAKAAAAGRAARLGISHLKGQSGRGAVSKRAAGSLVALTGDNEHARLARFQSEDLPTPPMIEEQVNHPVSAEADSAVQHRAGRIAVGERRRKRGSRRKTSDSSSGETVSVWSFNTSGAPQLRAAVGHANTLAADCPIAIMCQEHHAGPGQLADLQAQLGSAGWRFAATRAVMTPAGGRSAGVGVGTPTHVAAGIDDAMRVDCSPMHSPGRLAALWVQQIAPGGVLVLSCYLHDGEECSVRNLELLSEALQVARASGCPWIIGMDAQQPPEDLLKWAAPVIDRADGVTAAPDAPTHFPGVGCSRRLDYFILSRSLADAVVSVDTLSELRCRSRDADYTTAAKPHRVVRLRLKKRFQPVLLATLRTPRMFPRSKPIGCARQPVVPEAKDVEWASAEDRETRAEGAAAAWGSIVLAVEEELCGVCDAVDDKHRGRHEEATVVFRPALPRRAAGYRGAMAQAEFGVIWGMNRLRELLVLSELHVSKGALTAGQWKQWDNLLRKMCSPTAPIAGEDGRWGLVVEQLQQRRRQPGTLSCTLRVTHNWAVALANRQAKSRLEKRRRSWQEWIKSQGAAGGSGGALFNFLKRTEGDPEVVVRCNGVRSASPQAILEQDFAVWDGLWSKLAHLGSTPWRDLDSSERAEFTLPPLKHADLRKAARSFKPRTASGVDALVPAHFAWLSDPLLDRVGELFAALERAGCWPRQVALALVHLIPKAAGGRRPIGVLASMVRLWERARKAVVDDWRATCSRDYDWMSKGRGSERSVWAQALYEEAAAAERLSTASVFIDLVKAFEQVVLGRVWECGLKHSMPRPVLVLALEACTFSRRLTYKRAVSQISDTSTAILAGSGRATDLLFIALIDSVDGILLRHERSYARTTLRCFMIVDDIRLVVEGTEDDVATTLPQVAEDAVGVLEQELNMQVSRDQGSVVGKTVAQASSLRLGTRVQRRLKRLGVRVMRKVKNLGVQFVAGSKRGFVNQAAQDRYREGLRRLRRASALGRSARKKAVSSLFIPSFTFGSSAVSCPAALVRDLRIHTARAIGTVEGRSVSTRLLLEGADVAELITTKSIMTWVCGLWDGLIEPIILQRAWRHACVSSIDAAGNLRGTLSGATSYVATLRRLGWTAPSADSVRTRSGLLLYFGSGSVPVGAHMADPALVRRFVAEDYERAAVEKSTLTKDLADLSGSRGYPGEDTQAFEVLRKLDEGADDSSEDFLMVNDRVNDSLRAAATWRRGRFEHSEDGPVPWLWPVRVVMKSAKKAGLFSVAASIRALAEGGWPTQFRLRTFGYAEHAWCSCRRAVGTLRHKLGSCSLSQPLREAHCPEWVARCCDKEAWNPLFSRGILARPRAAKLPSDRSWFEAADHGDRGGATGDAYTDGSSTGSYWLARRGGWAVVSLDTAGRWRWTRYGTLGGPNVSSHRAELRALAEALRLAVPPLRVHTDNQDVVDGVACGRAWCTSSRSADADLWREVWDLLDLKRAIGEVFVVKVRAHTGWKELLERRITPRDQYGNWLADAAAKAGARQSEVEALVAAFRAQAAKALAWLKWVARYSTEWAQDIEVAERAALRRPREGHEVCNQPFDFGEAHLTHELWAFGNRAICRRCAVTRLLPEGQVAPKPGKCEGSAAGRAAARTAGNINFVWAQYAVSRAELTERGGRLISAIRPPKWLVDPGRLEEAAGDPERFVALTRYLLSGTGGVETDGNRAFVPPWLRAPDWLPVQLVQPWEKDEEALRMLHGCVRADLGTRLTGHKVAFSGPIAYCTRCACFAQSRLGSRFKGECVLPGGRALSAVSYRLARLRCGKHPITGAELRTAAG